MTGFDIAVLMVVGFGAITGFLRGFVDELLTLMAWVFSVLAIRYMHEPLTAAIQSYIGTETGSAVLAFTLLLLVPYAAIKVIAKWLGAKTRQSVLGPIDRLLGFGFGTVKGMILVILAFSVLMLGYDVSWGPTGRPIWITQARSYGFINAASEEMVTLIAERHQQAVEADTKAVGG